MMNKLKIFLALSISVLVLLIFASTKMERVQFASNTGKIDDSESCAPTTDGLKFCTDSRKITVNAGDNVSLSFSISNVSQGEIWINRNVKTSYSFVVKTEKGQDLATKMEEKLRNPTPSSEEKNEIIASYFISWRPEDTRLTDTLQERIVLSETYDLSTPGTYWIKVTRTTRNPTGEGFIKLHLDRIIIEVN